MYTLQDLEKVGENEVDRMAFVHTAIDQYKTTELYKTAVIAYDYARKRDKTIIDYQRLLYTVSGKAVPDNYSANFKLSSNFFGRFVTQETQYLLGNGVSWENDATAEKMGNDFDTQLQKIGKEALIGGVSYGFYNLDHTEYFTAREFVPIYDEENGALSAGIRFWQVAENKPLRATFYELDGFTEYLWEKGEGSVLRDKRAYIVTASAADADETVIYDGKNYPTFPIVPCYGNTYKQSELVGIREQIDAYDLIKSGFANDLDDASQIYWTVQNAGGMDDIDLAQFVKRMKTVRAVALDDGEQAQAHTIDIPYTAREIILTRLRMDLYRDYMALDTDAIASGAVTATQIRAAYEPVNSKADEFEYCIIEFIKGLLEIAGIEDNPTFTRSVIVNQTEEIENIVASAEFLSPNYVTEKILRIYGDADKLDDIIKEKTELEMQRAMMAMAMTGAENAETT